MCSKIFTLTQYPLGIIEVGYCLFSLLLKGKFGGMQVLERNSFYTSEHIRSGAHPRAHLKSHGSMLSMQQRSLFLHHHCVCMKLGSIFIAPLPSRYWMWGAKIVKCLLQAISGIYVCMNEKKRKILLQYLDRS